MLMLLASSATFDERLIQRSGSGETDNSGSNSRLATPRDEDIQPLNATIAMDSKHAAKLEAVASSRMEARLSSSVRSRKEYQGLYRVPPSLSSSSSLGAGEGRSVSRVLVSGFVVS
ncbi:hypothetical protein P691DRAFT_115043 [Macrolepiota fuliginosa MF-IS2]|uniref:Uncharacterized protein n=1 Tax=Macrolepiota fuliginosa MF-IS2 TaxID=1400762 RepID=A0A9P6C0K2_9AGAR|nr:hypothetical protein P691DRAFT_115043 [Macrolepiota fuliginosa MF-IS2]